MYANHIKYIRW